MGAPLQSDFIIQQPNDPYLSTLVDYYFYIETPVNLLTESAEYVIPFPRITFGYFFNHPFLVTNHELRESQKVDMIISRISSQKITVIPLSDKIKILGAHVKPYTLSYLTRKPINKLPWLIDTVSLFDKTAITFREKISKCVDPKEMFTEVESVFLQTLLQRDLRKITSAVDLVENNAGNIKLAEIANELGLSERAIRDQFHKFIGCAPKEFIQLVKLKKSIHEMSLTERSLTEVSYENNYFDQAHFINSFKKITGKSPNSLRKEMLNFRFLQF